MAVVDTSENFTHHHRVPSSSGLDPAGPNFASNPDRTVGIYSDVADFVDIIHTDRTLGSTPEDGQALCT